MVDLKLNPKLLDDSYKELEICVQNNKPFELNDDVYLVSPFSVGSISDFITMNDVDYKNIVGKLKSTKLMEKSNDLYKFRQSKDFKILKKSTILQDIRNFFLKSVLPWMKKVSDIELYDDEIDITYSIYKDTDYLLCHDDHLDARRIAFVWYLVDSDWSEENSGHLDLISEDNNGEPLTVARSFLPKHNNFIFFKVAENSYHQVREVKLTENCLEKSRISINGWFRGPPLTWKEVAVIPAPARLTPAQIDENLLYDWISMIYLQDEITKTIRKDFVDSSEVQLADFLNNEKYDELVKCLNAMDFELTGPMNVRQIYLPAKNEREHPAAVREILRLLGSDAMMVLLSDMTNLSLHSAAQSHSDKEETEDEDEEKEEDEEEEKEEEEEPATKKPKKSEDNEEVRVGKVSEVQLRQLREGCYTLLRDKDQRQKEFRLELYLSIGFPAEEKDGLPCGGYYSYFAENEDEELLTIVPSANALSLVYADDKAMGFMKYITHRYFDGAANEERPQQLYDFHATYYEYE